MCGTYFSELWLQGKISIISLVTNLSWFDATILCRSKQLKMPSLTHMHINYRKHNKIKHSCEATFLTKEVKGVERRAISYILKQKKRPVTPNSISNIYTVSCTSGVCKLGFIF